MRLAPHLSIFLCFCVTSTFSQINSSWNDVKKSSRGIVTVYWYDNNPFSFKDPKGTLKGLEVDIMLGFQKYLKGRYAIDLSIKWIQLKSFEEILSQVQNKSSIGIFSLGGFSITEQRRTFMKFSPSYMADISVFVSTEDIPIVSTKDDLNKYLVDGTAIVIPGTTMESDIHNLQEEQHLNFQYKYVSNSFDFLRAMQIRQRAYGYLALPVYLMTLNDGKNTFKRQNYFTQKKLGHGIGFPITNDWDIPLDEYFSSSDFIQNQNSIISNYINIDLYKFINGSTSESNLNLLNKEKDIHQMEIKLQSITMQNDSARRSQLIVVITVVTVLLISIVVLIRNKVRDQKVLKEQKDEIEAQSDEIKSINDNLEMIIQDRTQDLQRKRKALEEYALITSHNLKEPLNSIVELASKIDGEFEEQDKILVTHLKQSVNNLELIINSISDHRLAIQPL